MEKKMAIPVDALCKGLPSEFATYMNYTRGLKFADRPDYSYLKRLYKELFFREGYFYDFVFDWVIIKEVDALILRKRRKLVSRTRRLLLLNTLPLRSQPLPFSSRERTPSNHKPPISRKSTSRRYPLESQA